MYIKKFEVKTGKNEGYYIVTDNKKDRTYSALAKKWGILQYDCNYDFYRYHNVKASQYIWTHARWASKNFYKSTYKNYK